MRTTRTSGVRAESPMKISVGRSPKSRYQRGGKKDSRGTILGPIGGAHPDAGPKSGYGDLEARLNEERRVSRC